MEITASLVKELRERTGAGMMECKKALTENGGNIDAAGEWLRKSGLAKADKKADRVAAEGKIGMAQGPGKAVLVEVNSETDFVAKDANFIAFTDAIAQAALTSALQAASAAGNPEISPAHLLVALLDQTDGIAAPLLKAVGVDPVTVRNRAQEIVDRKPKASGSTTTPQLSRESIASISAAQKLATEMGDQFVSTEHVLYGLAEAGGEGAHAVLTMPSGGGAFAPII